MEAQLAATRQLIGLSQEKAVLPDAAPMYRGVSDYDTSMIQHDTSVTQLDKARLWLASNPNMRGLSLRKAADQAGVSLATMQRAIKAHSN